MENAMQEWTHDQTELKKKMADAGAQHMLEHSSAHAEQSKFQKQYEEVREKAHQ